MIKCTLTMTDWFTKQVTVKAITPKSPATAIEIHSRNNPNATCIIEWDEPKNSKLTLLPYNLIIDQRLVDEMAISIDEFTNRWYGNISNGKLASIKEELENEFYEEEEPEYDVYKEEIE